MNNQNLKPVASRTPAARRELASRAGRASGRRRRELKTAREALRELLVMPLSKETATQRDITNFLNGIGVPARAHTQLMGILVTLLKRAQGGEVRAAEACLKIAGEWPADKQEITTTETEPEVQYRFIDMTPEQGNEMVHEFYEARRKDREAEEERERRREERVKRIAMYKAGIFPDDEKKEPSAP